MPARVVFMVYKKNFLLDSHTDKKAKTVYQIQINSFE